MGMLPGFRWMFIPLTILVCCAIAFVLIRYHKRLCIFSRITLALLFAGAVGNLIDRIVLSYVRDFFDFCLINFPVFNVADSSLTIGCILLVIDALFLKDRSMFERVSLKTKGERKNGGQTPAGDGSNA
jgi:signal peptidase II